MNRLISKMFSGHSVEVDVVIQNRGTGLCFLAFLCISVLSFPTLVRDIAHLRKTDLLCPSW